MTPQDWAWDHRGCDFWLEAVYSQSEFEYESDEPETDDVDESPSDDDEEDELVAQASRRAAKAGK